MFTCTSDQLVVPHHLYKSTVPEYPHVSTSSSIIIDFGKLFFAFLGSSRLRAGYSNQQGPCIDVENFLTKYSQKTDSKTLYSLGALPSPDKLSKLGARTAFEQDVPFNFDVIESTLDGLFCTLGVDEYPINHSVVMTEVPCNPSRKQLTELFFEAYGFPKISLGCDALFSLYDCFKEEAFNRHLYNTILVSSGNYSTYTIPLVEGSPVIDLIKRIPIATIAHSNFILRLMQLKYPYFPTKMTMSNAEFAYKNMCYVAENFSSELKQYENSLEFFKQHDFVIQYPIPESNSNNLTEEEHFRILEEKRKIFSEKMKAHAEKKKNERIETLQSDLIGLRQMQADRNDYENEEEYLEMLAEYGYNSIADLEQLIFEYEGKLEKLLTGKDPIQKETKYDFSILDIPDSELSGEKIKEKRKLRLIKAGIDARERAKLEKEGEEKLKIQKEAMEKQVRDTDLERWVIEKRARRSLLKSKLKQLKQEREGLSDRRSTSSIRRIKSLTSLGHCGEPSLALKKKKKTKADRGEDDDPMFGDSEDDWQIYKELNKVSGRSDDAFEDDEKIENEINEIEEALANYDPNFWDLEVNGKKSSFIDRFLYGVDEEAVMISKRKEIEKYHQLHVNVERIRVPEILFQPSIIGLNFMGLTEILNETFSHINTSVIKSSENIFLTGGNVVIPGLPRRIYVDLRACRPINTTLSIFSPFSQQHSLNDIDGSSSMLYNSPWRGAASWAATADQLSSCWISKSQYEEEGLERCIHAIRSPFFLY